MREPSGGMSLACPVMFISQRAVRRVPRPDFRRAVIGGSALVGPGTG